MSDVKNVYRFDSDGYYLGMCKAQIFNGDLLLPPDCTEVQPTLKNGYWSKWSSNKWENEKIPTSCEEAVKDGLSCVSNSPKTHDQEVKAVLEALVATDSEHYKTVVDEKFVMTIEEIPEPTEDEKKKKADEDKDQALESAIDDLIKEMGKAELVGNEEWKAELRAEYEALMNGADEEEEE